VQAQSAKQAETVSGLLVKVADIEGMKPAVQADVERIVLDLDRSSHHFSQHIVAFQNLENIVSQLSQDFSRHVSVFDSYQDDFKSMDEKYRSSFVQVKSEFDDVLAAAMMNYKDDIDNRIHTLTIQIKQQEESISDVVETMGQQNSAQDKVIKEMREAVLALRSS
jgi:uncharacterized coiled-coil protein SlyX